MAKPEFTCSVAVRPLPEQSQPDAGQYAFAYTVTIHNTGDVTGQLIARHWVITDANGRTEEVRGLAVVGHQPVLKPGEHFEYTSWTRLGRPSAKGVRRWKTRRHARPWQPLRTHLSRPRRRPHRAPRRAPHRAPHSPRLSCALIRAGFRWTGPICPAGTPTARANSGPP